MLIFSVTKWEVYRKHLYCKPKGAGGWERDPYDGLASPTSHQITVAVPARGPADSFSPTDYVSLPWQSLAVLSTVAVAGHTGLDQTREH